MFRLVGEQVASNLECLWIAHPKYFCCQTVDSVEMEFINFDLKSLKL